MATVNINLDFVADAAGTVDVITATYNPAPPFLYDGLLLFFFASGANLTTTPTFNPNTLGAPPIVKKGGAPLVAGDIPGANALMCLAYDLGNTRWELLNPGSVTVTTPAALSKVDDTNVTLTLGGSPLTALLAATSLTLGWTGVLSPARGGTGVANNPASTLTISGNFATTLTITGVTTLTLPTSGTLATQAYADSLVVGLLDDRGNYDASVNTFPASGGSGTAGAILKGDLWTISVAGTLGGTAVTVGDIVRALTDTPGQTASNWAVSETNIGYVPLNSSLLDGKIYIGNGSNIGTAVTPSGDLTISNTGVVTLATVAATKGGTGQTVYAVGDLLYASTTTTLSKLAAGGTAGMYLRNGGAGTAPLWSALTLPNTATSGNILYATGTNAIGSNDGFFFDGTRYFQMFLSVDNTIGLDINNTSTGASANASIAVKSGTGGKGFLLWADHVGVRTGMANTTLFQSTEPNVIYAAHVAGGVHHFITGGASYTPSADRMNISDTGVFVGAGGTAATALLTIGAGTATVNTAQLQLLVGTSETTARSGLVQFSSTSASGIQAISGSRFTLTESDTTERYIVQAGTSVKTTAAAPYANDGFINVVINGTTIKLMTTA